MRAGGIAHFLHLRHQRFVNVETARRVEHHDVITAETPGLHGAARDLRRRLAGDDGQSLDAGLLAENFELFLRSRAARVERGHQYAFLFAGLQANGDLGCRRRLAGALKTDHHDRERRRRIEVDRLGLLAQRLDQLVMNDLDNHLAGRHRLDDLAANSFLTHAVREGAHDFQRHIGLDQRPADLAHRGRDIAVGQCPAPGELVENAGKAIG